MVSNIDKNTVRTNFSKNAESYDDNASVQKKCAERLVDIIDLEYFSKMLEVGCGTGFYTGVLKKKFPDSDITAIDIAKDMIEVARKKMGGHGVNFEVSDGEELSGRERFELITSNSSFQWFGNLERTFSGFREVLTSGGVLCFSMYGPETFCEFRDVLETHLGKGRWLSASQFSSAREVEELLKRHFDDVEIFEEKFTVDFLSIWDFLQNIKKTGARGEGISGGFLGKYTLKEMEKTYIEKFGGIVATHHVMFCRAKARER